MIIMVGGTFVFIAVAAYIYFYWYFATITAELARINKQVLAQKIADAYADILVLWQRYPRVVDIGCCAVDIAIEAKRFREAIEHADVCLQLLADPQQVNMGYFALLIQQSHSLQGDLLRNWLNLAIVRANFQRSYAEYDYPGAIACIEPLSLWGNLSVANAQSLNAYFHMLQGHYEEARSYLEQARIADAQDKQYLSIQGHWHLIHGEESKAMEYYRKHTDWPSLDEDFHHIQQVFGLKTPERRMVELK